AFERLAPDCQRVAAQIATVEVQQVEHVVLEPGRALALQCGLQRAERRHATGIGDDDFAIEDQRLSRQLFRRARDALEAVRPIGAAARVQTRVSRIDDQFDAVAVELDLVDPAIAGRRFVRQYGELWLDESWPLASRLARAGLRSSARRGPRREPGSRGGGDGDRIFLLEQQPVAI